MHVLEAMTGGTRRFLLDVALGLPREEFVQHVVISLRRDPMADEDLQALEAGGVEVSVVDLTRHISPLKDFAGYRTVRELVRAWRPHIVHGHSSKGGFLARAAARRAHLSPAPRTLYSPHCFAFQAPLGAARRRFYVALERLAVRWTDAFLLVSSGERKAALGAGLCHEGAVRMINLGVDTRQFTPQVLVSRQELGLPEGKLIGTVTSLRPQKAPLLLIEGFRRISMRFPAARLVVAGDGPMREQVAQLIRRYHLEERVYLLGYRTDIAQMLPHFSVLVMTSAWEGLPYALLEALACACPAVVPDLEGVADIVGSARAGVVFQPLQAASLAAALELVLSMDSEELKAWGEAGRKYVEQHHSKDAMVGALASLYKELGGYDKGG
jgi:glycosyltransferase involved in cell wall biosynthesis